MKSKPSIQPAEVVREYGPFDGATQVHGVSYDGRHVWAATGPRIVAFDPASGETVRRIEQPCDAGTAFDGTHLYQIAESRIDKIDPATGKVLSSIPAPGQGYDSGLTWAEGSLWVGQYRDRKIHQIDPASSPASPGSTASCGTAPGRPTTASCAASTPPAARCCSACACRRARA